MSAQDYPHYEIEFKSAALPADPNAQALQEAGATLLGPHSFILSPSKSRVQVTLAHHNDNTDAFPNLKITFTDVD